ncbi:ArsR/SmtB family transcription factor [Litoribacterium kuwaitense]|uniref:ArsR/SmtB family transcription factor n=1 Tax=Litoribacterium kuwaitense TaxID=1398745 RepID=UPI0028B1AEBC|nr:metalloregulator ArsR/SmtB family transcription factor [Litoribacterium kuwaitense]
MNTVDQVASSLKVLGDPTRLLMMKVLSEQEYCVCQLVEMFQMSQPAVSQHLKKLKAFDFVTERRQGQWRFYQVNPASEQVELVQKILFHLDTNAPEVQQLLARAQPMNCS